MLSTSDDARQLFDIAAEAYARAVAHSHLDGHERLGAAQRFLRVADVLATRPDDAIDIAWAELTSDDDERANAAARVLAELPDTRAGDCLLDAYDQPGVEYRLAAEPLARLGVRRPVPTRLWDYAQRTTARARDGAIRAVLKCPTDTGRVLLADLVTDDEWLGPIAVRSVAGWHRPKLLHAIAGSPKSLPGSRIAALTELAASGVAEAVVRLVGQAMAEDPGQAGDACYALSQLARPEGIGAVVRLLRDHDAAVVGLASSAARLYRAAVLGPRLIELIDGPAGAGGADRRWLAEESMRILHELTGVRAVERYDDSGFLTRDALVNAAAVYRRALVSLDPRLRYLMGQPLALRHLADLLLSPHTGPATAAAVSLRAITGEDHGYDVEADLIANAGAIRAWQKRAADSKLLEPGGWAEAAGPLPPPEPPS